MARTHKPGKRAAEQKFPHRVDVPVPEGGLGNRLNEMVGWCRGNIAAGKWAAHGHSEKKPGQIAVDHARFCFITEADADLFRWRWMQGSLAARRK